jgi:dTDP-4-dehydrorhamnose 3,5-epimerase
MRFVPTELPGAFVIEVEPYGDERGFFARTFCAREFAEHGLAADFVQCNTSYNHRAGTIRGMHWQAQPNAEAKLVRCTAGAIFDVIVDLRPGSPARGRWLAVELSAATRQMLYVPEGFAHGFQTLRDGSEIAYQMSAAYEPAAARGFRFDDPRLRIPWPLPASSVSKRDRELPFLDLGALDG